MTSFTTLILAGSLRMDSLLEYLFNLLHNYVLASYPGHQFNHFASGTMHNGIVVIVDWAGTND